MASGLASLAGYGSDSDEEDNAPVAAVAAPSQPSSSRLGSLLPSPKAGGLASKLPPPSYPSLSKASGLSLPPPTSSSSTKRKVIKVDSLPSYKADADGDDWDDGSDTRTDSKKPKIGGGSSSKHSLFGMLPAPKRKDDEVLAERSKQAEAKKAAKAVEEADASTLTQAPLRIDEDVLRATSPTDQRDVDADAVIFAAASSSKPKGKNNDAFRAMLGLKPAASKHKPAAVPAASSPSTSTSMKPSSATSIPLLEASRQSPPHQLVPGSVQASSSKTSAPVDFFSLETPRHINGAASAASRASSLSVSAAPAIEHPESPSSTQTVEPAVNDDASDYPGWQLDPDGSWVPITPEAHAQLLAYQQSLPSATPSTASTLKSASNLDGTRDLLAAGLTPEDIRAFDASSAARQAYSGANGDSTDTEKYAAAAEFAAGNREVQQRKPGMLKGLRKGQLSSLVSLAGENRSQLEERWKRGREAKAQRSNRYGF